MKLKISLFVITSSKRIKSGSNFSKLQREEFIKMADIDLTFEASIFSIYKRKY